MKKTNETKRKSFFKEKPQNLYKLIESATDKMFEARPFSLLISHENRAYAELIVKECKVSESAVSKILVDSFEWDSITLDILGNNHEASEQGEVIFKAYTKAIEALKKAAQEKVIVDDKSYSGCAYGRKHISLTEALLDDVQELKKKRAEWASLFTVHTELKAEPISKTATGMFTNQAYNLFLYIKKCHDKADYKAENVSIHELISELFTAIYDHPLFNAVEKFTPQKIKEYCDNGPRQRKMKKTSLRKQLKSL